MRSTILRLYRTVLSAAALCAFGLAAATTAPPPADYSDLWGKSDESGWGLNLTKQADAMFGTLFVYGEGEQAIWYSATFVYQYTGANNVVVWSGTSTRPPARRRARPGTRRCSSTAWWAPSRWSSATTRMR